MQYIKYSTQGPLCIIGKIRMKAYQMHHKKLKSIKIVKHPIVTRFDTFAPKLLLLKILFQIFTCLFNMKQDYSHLIDSVKVKIKIIPHSVYAMINLEQ